MPLDLATLGPVLTFVAPGIFAFESTIFNSIDPKDAGPLLDLHREKVMQRLQSRIFWEMDDDVTRSVFSRSQDATPQEVLIERRKYAASVLTHDFWVAAEDHALARSSFVAWRAWARHGRLVAYIATFCELVLFAALSVWALTGTVPLNIPVSYYWTGFLVIAVPFTYVFVCWLIAQDLKRKCEHKLENPDTTPSFMETP